MTLIATCSWGQHVRCKGFRVSITTDHCYRTSATPEVRCRDDCTFMQSFVHPQDRAATPPNGRPPAPNACVSTQRMIWEKVPCPSALTYRYLHAYGKMHASQRNIMTGCYALLLAPLVRESWKCNTYIKPLKHSGPGFLRNQDGPLTARPAAGGRARASETRPPGYTHGCKQLCS